MAKRKPQHDPEIIEAAERRVFEQIANRAAARAEIAQAFREYQPVEINDTTAWLLALVAVDRLTEVGWTLTPPPF